MSYGIIRIQKFTKGSVHGIWIHDQRKKDVSHTNQDIDFSKSYLNYSLDLENEEQKKYHEIINERIESLELKKAVRKDAIVMSQVLVTSDHEFFEKIDMEQQKKFFQDSYEFIKKTYGKENIVSATVHLDERTPHMHVNFVPVTEDNRLSAKSLFTPATLRKLQDNFYETVGKEYGLERGEKGSNKKHLETKEYKELMAQQEELKKEIKHLTADRFEAKCGYNQMRQGMLTNKVMRDDLEAKIKRLEKEQGELIQKNSAEQSRGLLELEKIEKRVILLEKQEKSLKGQIEGHMTKRELQKTELERAEKIIEVMNATSHNLRTIDSWNKKNTLNEKRVEHKEVGVFKKEQVVSMPEKEWNNIKAAYQSINNYNEIYSQFKRQIIAIFDKFKTDDITTLEKEIEELKEKNHNLERINRNQDRAISKLEEEKKETKTLVNKTLDKITEDTNTNFKKLFIEEYSQIQKEQTQEQTYELER